jgi:mRNA interferase MazF
MKINKYDIFLVDLNPTIGSEQSEIRPCLIVQNDLFYEYQNTTLILPISSNNTKTGNFKILLENYKAYGLDNLSTILSFQIRSIDKKRCIKKLGNIDNIELRKQINQSVRLCFDSNDEFLG